MSPEEIQQLEIFLLLSLNAAGEVGMPAGAILVRARTHTFASLTQPVLDVQLRALADRHLVISYAPTLGASRWKITARGNAALAEQGLA